MSGQTPVCVTVRYHNILRSATGITEEAMMLAEGASVYALLEALATAHGPPLREMLLEADGAVVSHLVAFRNRKLVSSDPRGVVLTDGDEILLFPAVSGG